MTRKIRHVNTLFMVHKRVHGAEMTCLEPSISIKRIVHVLRGAWSGVVVKALRY